MYLGDDHVSWDFISDAFYPDWIGGLQRYATELAVAAQQAGGDVSIWTRVWSHGGLAQLQEGLPGARVRGLGDRIPKRFRGLIILGRSLLGLSAAGRLSGTVRVAHTAVLGNLFFSPNSSAMQIYVFHASPSLELRAKAASTGPFTLKQRLHSLVLLNLERRCLSKADKVVVLSEYSKSLVSQVAPSATPKVVVLPGGSKTPDLGASDRSRDARPKKLVTVRRLEWRMGIDLLIEAFARSQVMHEGWILEIVGSGSEFDSLVSLAESLGVASAVSFSGRVSDEEKLAILSEASLFILPTRAHEGFGLATVEAMSAGVIPIVTAVGASPEIVGQLDEALICSPTVSSLTDAIVRWTRSERTEGYADLRERSRAIASTYGWDVVYGRWRELVLARR